mmetsp:Transcript_26576/g.45495  ORF Transcript_26576/g.45495 Transcript_26576/m.45495 type:complete len:328 (-) Transcript_26576:28-1011(-)|eukprot:CAMPEP_0206172422 /NCGR_PEP_ID=MMETSP1474-20131121/45482_1 /ASSEMBLY_ACC=CAM_ASM_001110 /TAXON_ID=97495 /ORGANISM="Imantonia sp., Strain RCC918" /LENGTH=327 /DNA_ID=CAMNT_0053580553 /DNA_START=68 /DNA_END=1051 /DNA_ORIENTATION=-
MNNRMINLGFITTLSEVITEEFVGKEVIDDVTGKSYGVRKGTLEALAEEIAAKESEFSKNFNLTAIVLNDDHENVDQHFTKGEGYDVDMKVPIHEEQDSVKVVTLKDITTVIPSSVWRGIPIPPRGSDNRAEVIAKRKQLKEEYEDRICKILRNSKVDILISNSYTNIIGPRLLNEYKNMIINIHPAITSQDNPCRLPGVTPTRDAYTRATKGFVIVDDKKSVSLDGEEETVHFNGEERKAVKFPEEHRYTHGVTVHVVTAGVDEGPPIHYEEYDLRDHFNVDGSNTKKPLLTEEAIREHNYNMKPSVLIKAIMKHAEHPETIERLQ